MTPIAAEAQQAGGLFGGNSMWVMILIYAVIIGGIYFFLIRPNSKKKKEEAQMRNSLEIGDEITTIGGIMGRVVAIKDDEDAIIIETGSDRVKMKFKKWCISTVDTVKNPAETKIFYLFKHAALRKDPKPGLRLFFFLQEEVILLIDTEEIHCTLVSVLQLCRQVLKAEKIPFPLPVHTDQGLSPGKQEQVTVIGRSSVRFILIKQSAGRNILNHSSDLLF